MEIKEPTPIKAEKQYDKIVEGYKKQTERPLRKFAYDYTLVKNLGDLSGKRVLDLACGEGISSRLARDLGAKEVVGIDESVGQIKKAEAQERESNIPEKEKIKYIVADGGALPLRNTEKFDVVTGVMFLNYAETKERLDRFIAGIKESLQEGGTFYAMLPNPDVVTDYEGYGVKMKTDTPQEGSVVDIEIFDFEGNKLSEFKNHYWSRDTYQKELEKQGFSVEWINSEVSPEGEAEYGKEFWEDYKKRPVYVMIKAEMKEKQSLI